MARKKTISKGPTLVEPRALSEALQREAPPLVVDVRTGMEFGGSHVAGSINLPLQSLTASAPELSGAKEVWLICRTGNRSSQAARALAASGLKVMDVRGGLMAWKAAGYPVERGRSIQRLFMPAVASLTLGLAPFTPEPHVFEKLRAIAGGAEGMAVIDFFDLAMHGSPWVWLAVVAAQLVLPQRK
jgi:rhodanese-related sulfurtransferase